MMRFLVLSLLALNAAAAEAPAVPLSSLATKAYATLEQAALSALIAVAHLQVKGGQAAAAVEYGGTVFEIDGRFYHSIPVTQGLRSSVQWNVWQPLSAAPVALYHSHPADPKFSAQDRRNAQQLELASYLLTTRDHIVLRYEPASGTTSKLGFIAPVEGDAWGFWPE